MWILSSEWRGTSAGLSGNSGFWSPRENGPSSTPWSDFWTMSRGGKRPPRLIAAHGVIAEEGDLYELELRGHNVNWIQKFLFVYGAVYNLDELIGKNRKLTMWL